jgi:hypothetical protein
LELAAGDDAGRCCGGAYKAVAVVGRRVRETRAREGGWAKNASSSCWSSVWGAVLETATGDDRGRWWGGRYEAATVVGWWVHKTRGEVGVGAKNPKRAAIARFWAGFGLQADVWGPV